METAYHRDLDRHFTVKQYIEEYGPKLDRFGNPRHRPEVLCYACSAQMHTVGEGLPARDGHWAHNPSDQAPWCPLKQSAARPYELLAQGKDVSAEQGQILRQQVLDHWRQHWGHIQELMDVPDIHGFIGFIRWADKKQLWRHKGLCEWFIPYIYLSVCELPPPTSPKALEKRGVWLRFWFDGRVRTVEDLWIRTTGDFRMMKASYSAPARGGSPTAKSLIRIDPIKPDAEFLARRSPPSPNPYQVQKMHEAFCVG